MVHFYHFSSKLKSLIPRTNWLAFLEEGVNGVKGRENITDYEENDTD